MVILIRYKITLESNGDVSAMKQLSQVDTDITPPGSLEPNFMNVKAGFEGEVYGEDDIAAIRESRRIIPNALKKALNWKGVQ